MTDFDRLSWERTAKGQRSAPGPHYRLAGRYVLTRDWGIPGLPDHLPEGARVYLSSAQATQMRDTIEPEGS